MAMAVPALAGRTQGVPRTMKPGINVGISVFARAGAHAWSSGINQNIAFLVMLLRQIERVDKVYLLNGGDLETLPPGLGFDALEAPLVWPREVTHEVDLVIEMGAQLPLEWLRHVRALGARVVSFFVGHVYADLGESAIFQQAPGYLFNGTPWHEIWIQPHHAKTCAPLLATVSRVPVRTVPHLWSPYFIERRVREVEAQGMAFGYVPTPGGERPAPWRAAIFEPNISVVKTCFTPMLACESAYRERNAAIALMMVMNTFHLKEHLTFNRFALSLSLTRDGKASYEPRLDFVEGMAGQRLDVVVSHQWECGLNYLYYDALYGGYPLIHNSPYLEAAKMGFHYPDFDAVRAGGHLLALQGREEGYWRDYRDAARRFLSTVSPAAGPNVAAFAHRIAGLMEREATACP